MRPAATLLVLVCLFTAMSVAQTAAPTALPQFEVATIKPIDTTRGVMHMGGVKVFPGGRVTIGSSNLKTLICVAFDINFWQLKGGDAWAEKDRYDLEAKPGEADPPMVYSLLYSNFSISDERLRQMLQALLIERFHLTFHRETATGQILLLEKSGKPVAMQPSKHAGAKMYGEGYSGEVGFAGNRWGIYNASMPQVASFASNFLKKTVLDRTGLEGPFDFRWIVADADPHANGETFMETYQTSFPLFLEAAGLKLTKSTGPIETLVIDHAEPPIAN